MRLLLLEADRELCQTYLRRLRNDGHAVDEVATLAAARDALRDVDYDCLVLDHLVPDGDALDLVAELRAEADRRAVLVISALGDTSHRARGLALGADDYVAKPVSAEELALRVHKVLLRRTPEVGRPPLRVGRVTVHRVRAEADLDGRAVELTPLQYALLAHLAERLGEVVPSEELIDRCIDRVRGDLEDPLPPHVSRLRRKFAGVLDFRSCRGQGYALHVVEPEQPPGSPAA